MAATFAEGETVIENAAREPEVVDLASMLVKMGAKIEGAGTSTIKVQGVSKLHGVEHEIIADRIEAGTYMIAAAITGGEILLSGCVSEHLAALIAKMRQAGVDVTEEGATGLRVRSTGTLRATDITTEEHPGFAYGSAGAVHGVDDAGGWDFLYHGNDLRESLHARSGAGAYGRQHPD